MSGSGGDTGHAETGGPVSGSGPIRDETPWWKSSHSDPDNGSACVEVRFLPAGGVEVRDSTHPDGPVLPVSSEAWLLFVRQVKRNAL